MVRDQADKEDFQQIESHSRELPLELQLVCISFDMLPIASDQVQETLPLSF